MELQHAELLDAVEPQKQLPTLLQPLHVEQLVVVHLWVPGLVRRLPRLSELDVLLHGLVEPPWQGQVLDGPAEQHEPVLEAQPGVLLLLPGHEHGAFQRV